VTVDEITANIRRSTPNRQSGKSSKQLIKGFLPHRRFSANRSLVPHVQRVHVEEPEDSIEVVDISCRPLAIEAPPLRIPRKPLAQPTPAPKRTVKLLRKKQAKCLADKAAKAEKKIKKKRMPKEKRYCKICEISCNGPKTFYDHVQSKAHKSRRDTKRSKPYCRACQQLFESHAHLNRHLNSKAHLKVVSVN